MDEQLETCLICKAPLLPGRDVYEVRHFLDPVPPSGYACSERCAKRAEQESKMRSYVAIDLLGG